MYILSNQKLIKMLLFVLLFISVMFTLLHNVHDFILYLLNYTFVLLKTQYINMIMELNQPT